MLDEVINEMKKDNDRSLQRLVLALVLQSTAHVLAWLWFGWHMNILFILIFSAANLLDRNTR